MFYAFNKSCCATLHNFYEELRILSFLNIGDHTVDGYSRCGCSYLTHITGTQEQAIEPLLAYSGKCNW